jgi:hypothetical protein
MQAREAAARRAQMQAEWKEAFEVSSDSSAEL